MLLINKYCKGSLLRGSLIKVIESDSLKLRNEFSINGLRIQASKSNRRFKWYFFDLVIFKLSFVAIRFISCIFF